MSFDTKNCKFTYTFQDFNLVYTDEGERKPHAFLKDFVYFAFGASKKSKILEKLHLNDTMKYNEHKQRVYPRNLGHPSPFCHRYVDFCIFGENINN